MKFSKSALAASLLWLSTAALAHAAPNLQGVWKIAKPMQSLPVSGPIPFTAEGLKHYNENKSLRAKRKFDEYDITLSRCSTPGVPRLMLTPQRFRIVERYGYYTFDFEWNQALRQINASKLPDRPDVLGYSMVPKATGVSRGKWDGDTLVAVTDNIAENTLLDDLIPHTGDLKVTERIRLIDADTLEDRITIEDPAYFTRPWDAVITYKRQPDAIFPEDVCLDRIAAGQPAFPKP